MFLKNRETYYHKNQIKHTQKKQLKKSLMRIFGIRPVLSSCEFEHEHSAEHTAQYGGYTEDVYGYSTGLKYYEDRNGYVSGCRRCKLEQKFQRALNKAETMTLRTFHFSRYQAAKAAEKYFR